MTAYYNEWEAYPAQWLRNLIKAGLIAPGDVDERSIKDVKPDDIKGYTQCHFFAGIGGWSLALRLAKWPDERPVWTGSCPCQPFSPAGKQTKQSDERHLWPHWSRLIAESKPAIVFGEQVAEAIAAGWADEVSHDLETQEYAFASAVLPACSVGAPHRRYRYWFVADSECGGRWESLSTNSERESILSPIRKESASSSGSGCKDLADPDCARLAHLQGSQRKTHPNGRRKPNHHDWWDIEPSVGRVADGIPARAPKLRGYGNAIVPQVAQAFIEAFMKCKS